MTEEQKLEQERILKEWSWEDCYRFARDIEWANKKELEKRVLEIWDWYDCYIFARRVDWANKKELEKRVLEIWSWNNCYYFARRVEWANKKELEKRVLEIWDWRHCYRFATDIDWADKETLLARARELWYTDTSTDHVADTGKMVCSKSKVEQEAKELMKENDIYRAGIDFAVLRFYEISHKELSRDSTIEKRQQEMESIYTSKQQD